MVSYVIESILLDNKYNVDDYELITRIIITPHGSRLYGWDGLEWNINGLNRVYINPKSQKEFDNFLERIYHLRDSELLYEIARDLGEDQSFYFEKERIYLYISKKKSVKT
ncbi:MAG: hypothetical protein LUG89_02500 [Methanosphaera sp.]|nr:hypothetical protein [Methanosphaera sp.]